jgi:hypothetical protein
MTAAVRPGDAWQSHAACAGQALRIFFTRQPEAAKAICRPCPVRAECLHDALISGATNGIWGGLTAKERDKLPALPPSPAAAITALGEVLAAYDPPVERTTPLMNTTPTSAAPVAEATAATLPVDSLLAWGDEHADTEIQDQAARARAALAGLRSRYDADQELTTITTEAQQLEKRLAELRAREQELAPPKTKAARRKQDLGYDSPTVRAWARGNNVACPPTGRIPKAVVDAWRTATSPAAGAQ